MSLASRVHFPLYACMRAWALAWICAWRGAAASVCTGAFICGLFLLLSPAPVAHAQSAPVQHPQGEWYHVGYRMARQANPSYRLFGISDAAALTRLIPLIQGMGVAPSEYGTSDIALLEQGWGDGILDRPEALTFPADQQRSILPFQLRGLHPFPADIEAARIAAEEANRPATLAKKAAQWKQAIVKVIAWNEREPISHGSGFFIGPGLLVTNYHVVDEGVKFTVQLESDETTHSATVIASQEIPDIALLRIRWQGNASLPIGNSDLCQELEEVVMIGYPKFINQSATLVKGAISLAHRRYVDSSRRQFECLQLDIRANPGNSGGPIISLDGHVVGILTFGLSAEDARLSQFTFAQRSAWFLPFLQKNAGGQFQYLGQ